MLYLRNPKGFSRKLLDIINTFSKVSGYKVNTKISSFLYTTRKSAKKDTSRKKILFVVALKK